MNILKSPDFNIDPSSIVAELKQRLINNRQQLAKYLENSHPTWENLIAPIEHLSDCLNQFWAPISHLNAVSNNDTLRKAYNACLPLLSDYATEIGHNKQLFAAYKTIKKSAQFKTLNQAQQAAINYTLRDFRLSGIDLQPQQQQRYKAISVKLSALSSKFSENILDTTKSWQKHIADADKNKLAGLPTQRQHAARQAAATKGLSGWLLNLDYPCYHDVITYADSATLREEFYHAFNTRASDQGPHAAIYDNSAPIQEILELRHELATLLGFANYAELSLQPKMANSAQQVLEFLQDLVSKVKPAAKVALENLQKFAKTPQQTLPPWDVAYYSEKLRQQEYAVNSEAVRAYFPAAKVIKGLFTIVNKLYGFTLKQKQVDVWHADVMFYELYDENQVLFGGIYFDLYARENKRGGAWMDELVSRRKLTDGRIQLPIALLNCNFANATEQQPALFKHDDVITLFHEFGHCLQHVLTTVDHLDVSGLNNVPWDAVEFPSQFFESWCWQPESLRLLSSHYQSAAPLPDTLINKLIAAKNFQAPLFLIRQLEFALFDLRLHTDYNGKKDDVQKMLQLIRDEVAIMPVPDYHRFAHTFSHIFAGGYAAGYYSYLWAEVLARDAFSAFEQSSIFNRQLSEKFKNTVLAKGGSVTPEELFIEFMGRKPNNAALLRYYGIEAI